MGTNCATLLADILLFTYTKRNPCHTVFVLDGKETTYRFNLTTRYIDDVLPIKPSVCKLPVKMYPDDHGLTTPVWWLSLLQLTVLSRSAVVV